MGVVIIIRIELQDFKDLGQQGIIPGYEASETSTTPKPDKKIFRVRIPGFARYYIKLRRNRKDIDNLI